MHRDVKPQNVLIDPEGRAKVTDFGIARSLEAKGLTATGRVLGTTDYVAPEQAMGQSIDARSDVYSLGVLLYEMLTGEVPFHAETQVGVAMKHVNEPLPDAKPAPRGVGRARGRRRSRNRQGPGRSLPGHGGDAARPRVRARGRGIEGRKGDRRGDNGARLGLAAAADLHPTRDVDRRNTARARGRRGRRRDRRRDHPSKP